MSSESTNRLPTCLICGDPINESAGEVPVYVGYDASFGEYDGEAYHMNCEGEVFDEVYAEVDPDVR